MKRPCPPSELLVSCIIAAVVFGFFSCISKTPEIQIFCGFTVIGSYIAAWFMWSKPEVKNED